MAARYGLSGRLHADAGDAQLVALGSGVYRVTTAQNGSEMHKALTEWQIDLMVLDLMMPRESGLELCRGLRASGSKLPIIMLTALGEETDRIVGLEMGADDYLAKPFNPRELDARCRDWRRNGSKSTQHSSSTMPAMSARGSRRKGIFS